MSYFMNSDYPKRDNYNERERRIMHRGEIYFCYKRPEDVEIGSEMHYKKGRPCILVSKEEICNSSPIVTVVNLTSSPKTDYPTHVVIDNVKLSSTAICESPQSVSKARLGELVGKVSDLDMKAIDRALVSGLELDYLLGSCSDDSKLHEDLLVVRTERDTYKRMVDTFIKSK